MKIIVLFSYSDVIDEKILKCLYEKDARRKMNSKIFSIHLLKKKVVRDGDYEHEGNIYTNRVLI